MKRLLIVGCGDVATRALPQLAARFRVSAMVRTPREAGAVAAPGVRVIWGDLDRPDTFAEIVGAADCIVHSVPPPDSGETDTRTRNLLGVLSAAQKSGAMLPQRLVYLSTSGVYGDCKGERVDETRAVNPGTDRARRRADAELVLSEWCGARGVALAVLRVPGIYAANRLPLERLRARTPALRPEDDVYTNHIHADDLAAIIVAASQREEAQGVFNANDDTELKMGDYFDLVADRQGLPRPPRISRSEAARCIPEPLLSFLSESRRLVNRRMKDSFGVRLRYPTVYDGLPQAALAG